MDELYQKLFTEESVKKLISLLNDYNQKNNNDTGNDLINAKDELSRVVKKISNIINFVAENGVSVDTVQDNIKDLEDRKAYLENQIRELSLNVKTISNITEETLLNLIHQSKDFIFTKNIAECKGFINHYIDRVIVGSDKVEIIFKVNLPTGDGNTFEPLKSIESIEKIKEVYKSY